MQKYDPIRRSIICSMTFFRSYFSFFKRPNISLIFFYISWHCINMHTIKVSFSNLNYHFTIYIFRCPEGHLTSESRLVPAFVYFNNLIHLGVFIEKSLWAIFHRASEFFISPFWLLCCTILIFIGEIRERDWLSRIGASTLFECFVHAVSVAIVETVITCEWIGFPSVNFRRSRIGSSFAICKGN